METREPYDLWLLYFDPIFVLLESSLEMSDPIDQFLFGLRGKFSPNWWQQTVEEAISKNIKIDTHTNLTLQCSLEIGD